MTTEGIIHAFGPLFRFHIRVGTRLALRRLGPVLAGLFFLFMFLRPEFFMMIVVELGRSGGPVFGGVTALVGWLSARQAAPRLLLGLPGWLRHLPAASGVQVRSALAGLWVAQVPILLVLGLLYVLAHSGAIRAHPAYLAGLPVMGWAAGLAVFNTENRMILRPPALLAAALSVSGSWILLGSSLALVLMITRFAGRIVRFRTSPFSFSAAGPLGLEFVILWRSLGWRLATAYFLALPPFLATYAFLVNNPVTSLQAGRSRLFGFAMAVVVFTSVAANGIASRRPAWPWKRSLALSSSGRIAADAGFLAIHAIPVLVPLAMIDGTAFFFLFLSLPPVSLLAAAVMRKSPEQRVSTLGIILFYGSLGGVLLTVFPWISIVFFLSLPLLLRMGSDIEKRRKVSRWLEFHHLAAGDPHSWSQE